MMENFSFTLPKQIFETVVKSFASFQNKFPFPADSGLVTHRSLRFRLNQCFRLSDPQICRELPDKQLCKRFLDKIDRAHSLRSSLRFSLFPALLFQVLSDVSLSSSDGRPCHRKLSRNKYSSARDIGLCPLFFVAAAAQLLIKRAT